MSTAKSKRTVVLPSSLDTEESNLDFILQDDTARYNWKQVGDDWVVEMLDEEGIPIMEIPVPVPKPKGNK